MVALSSSAAQRACLLIHKRAITKSVEDGQWRTAVRVLELMIERSNRLRMCGVTLSRAVQGGERQRPLDYCWTGSSSRSAAMPTNLDFRL
jgi:hypothetical protein